jgi:hypothetical protein
MAWYSAGILTNPAIDTILADNTGLSPSGCSHKVMLGSNVATVATVEHRNAANTANVASQVIACAANEVRDIDFIGINFQAGERLRVRLNAAITGACQASIMTI